MINECSLVQDVQRVKIENKRYSPMPPNHNKVIALG
jgi:hypothetical protein